MRDAIYILILNISSQ